VFRVNRRPLPESLFSTKEGIPKDVFDHFRRVLAPGWKIITGRRHQRTWRIGGLEADKKQRVLTGKLGWEPRGGEEVLAQWSEHEKDWVSSPVTIKGGQAMPFGFDGETRLLTVLKDRSSAPATIALVIERTLQQNEAELDHPSTEWRVEPVLDRQRFTTWLSTVDVLTSVSFHARLPNPEPKEAFADVVDRMERLHATEYRETLVSKREEGLENVEEDPEIQQAIALGQEGFATLQGKGRRGKTTTRFNQRDRLAKERVTALPETWDEMRGLITRFLKDRLRRFLSDEEAV
jgi:hypothetical protein